MNMAKLQSALPCLVKKSVDREVVQCGAANLSQDAIDSAFYELKLEAQMTKYEGQDPDTVDDLLLDDLTKGEACFG